MLSGLHECGPRCLLTPSLTPCSRCCVWCMFLLIKVCCCTVVDAQHYCKTRTGWKRNYYSRSTCMQRWNMHLNPECTQWISGQLLSVVNITNLIQSSRPSIACLRLMKGGKWVETPETYSPKRQKRGICIVKRRFGKDEEKWCWRMPQCSPIKLFLFIIKSPPHVISSIWSWFSGTVA